MNSRLTRVFTCCLVVVFLAGLTYIPAAGAGFSDIQGHWAEAILRRAAADGYLQGSDNRLRPNDPVTGAEIITVLTRVFSAVETADLSAVTDIKSGDWYYSAAAKAAAMGIIQPSDGQLRLGEAMTRKEAFLLLAKAFQLIRAGQDTSLLSQYADGDCLTGKYREAAAALAGAGYIKGYGGGLHVDAPMTRAEFMTVFYDIVPNFQTPDTAGASAGGDVLLSGISSLSDVRFPGSIYFDCTPSAVNIRQVAATAAVIRSGRLDALHMDTAEIGRLVLAAGGDLVFTPDATNKIQTVAVGDGQGTVTLGGNLVDVEITGSGRTVILSAPVQNLRVGGSGNTIIIGPGITVNDIKLFGTASGNTLTLDGSAASCTVYGPDTVISGAGVIEKLTDNTAGCSVTVSVGSSTSNKDYGLNGVRLSLTAPDSLPPEQALDASVLITSPFTEKACRGAWYLDGKYIAGADLVLSPSHSVPLRITVPRTADIPVTARLSFVLSYNDPDGSWQETGVEKRIMLEPPHHMTPDEILQAVTTGYHGNYTLAWTEKHDYDAALKEDWINLKGYTSKTEYLVWVSIAYQRVNVFSGSAGHWKLEKTFIVGTGASGNDTPTGTFKILGRNTKGWTTKDYTVKPLVFFNSYAYAFHSRLYYPKTATVSDKRIGFPISHGCIRMYDEDVAWIYDNIPTGTTVVVY